MKHLTNWGGILGLALIVYSLALYLLGLNESQSAQWLSYLIIAAFIFIASKAKRTELGGYISYGQALGNGVGVAFFASIMVAFYTYVFFHFIDPDMLEQLILRAEDQLYENGMPDDQIEMAMSYTRKLMQPGPMAFMVVLTYTFVGFIVSLITSAIVKKEDSSFEGNFK
ncbi:MAG: DUF4199 domain-containing protein [Flavobacteriales bacterium]|nr:DUF4199 domain-containing protein [Flavobacteriales bacterium]